MAKQPNQSQAGTNIQQVRQQNAQSAGGMGSYGTEFASETNAAEVRKQNAQSAGAQGSYGTEFASETNAAEVRQQNQQAEARKAQNSGGQSQ